MTGNHGPAELKKKVLACVDLMKDPERLLQGCAKYLEAEKRDCVYVVALEYAERHERSPKSILFAAQTLLLAWNTPLYCKKMYRMQNVGRDLKSVYDLNDRVLMDLKSKKLGELIPEDLAKVRELFRSFGQCDSIYWTGASKALHVANPALFVMWDNDIRTAYHLLHDSHDESTCYEEFSKASNDIAKVLISKKTETELSLHHPAFESTGVKRTVAKMMDEYNYAVIKPIGKLIKAELQQDS